MPDDPEEAVGEEILPLVLGPVGDRVAAALAGCRYYRDDPEAAETILSCERNGRLLLRGADGRQRAASLGAGFILLSTDAGAALEDALGPQQRRERDQRAFLAAFGLTARVAQQDLASLCKAIEEARGGGVPERPERQAVIALLEAYEAGRQVERLCKLWLGNMPSPPPGDVLIALIHAQRHMGKTSEALAGTDRLLARDHGLDRGDMRVLFCQRAALWLDLYEQAHDPQLLSRARQSAGRSWAIAPSEECSAVYNRLAKFERELR